jgi:uncharacterized membrane protein YedE/YeeE
MEATDLVTQYRAVLWAAFFVAAVFGFVAQRTHFCTMGAISDVVNMGSWVRMRMWGMAVGVAVIGFHLMAAAGWIDPSMTIYASGRIIWLSAIAGGLLFGFGMVLASGCGSKTLVRMGSGSLKALVVFFVMGLAAFATLRGITAVVRVRTVDAFAFELPTGASIPRALAALLGVEAETTSLVVALLVGVGLIAWARASADFRQGGRGVLAGLGIGGAIVGMWWVSGRLGFVPEHPETLEAVYLATNSGRMEAMTFTAPMAYTLDWLIHYSDTSKHLTLGVVSVAGVVFGAWVQAMLAREFRWEGFQGTRDTALHLVGAACMGVGGVTAMGCTVGQGLSGLSTLGLTSVIAVAGIVLGALGGLRFQEWLLERE